MILGFFISALNLIMLSRKSYSINVALGKMFTYCDTRNSSSVLTNGNHNDAVPETFTEICNRNSYIEGNLMEKYHIQRVCVISTGRNFDYFVVKLFVGSNFELCSEYPRLATGNDWVICQYQPATDKVRLETRYDNGMILHEIEVHAEGDNGKEEIFHEGCFTEFEGEQKPDADIYECRKICSTISKYFGMKNLKNCFCGDTFNMDKEALPSKCYVCDSISTIKCGGPSTFSVYKTENRRSYYHGCFPNRDLFTDSFAGNINLCLSSCPFNLFIFSRDGYACKCVDRHETLLGDREYILCNKICDGHPTTFCGGSSAVSVYKTCYYGENSFPCEYVYRCSQYNVLGSCNLCNPGYTGFGCVHRISGKQGCWVENACNNHPHTTCKNVGDSFICQCRQNYTMNAETGMCEGKFEESCHPGICANQSNTKCDITEGRLECICLEGYQRDQKGNCIESCHPGICANQSNTICDITEGRLECICLGGYHRDKNGNCIEV